jgi:hypothetical protein
MGYENNYQDSANSRLALSMARNHSIALPATIPPVYRLVSETNHQAQPRGP